ncbi:MAG: sodium:proton antiporter [Pirellulales bacterium]|nr:sodium:proton antiporter [Pirellulales bacterium]
MSHSERTEHQNPRDWTATAILIILITYFLLAAIWELPKLWRDGVVLSQQHSVAETDLSTTDESASDTEASGHGGGVEGEHPTIIAPALWMILPFAVLLVCIAILPLIPATEHWWESNLNRFIVAAGLGILTLIYYGLLHHAPMEGHWPAHHIVEPQSGSIQWGFMWTTFANAILHEFVPFIVLLFSLYTICGGIRIEGDLQANPLTNASFLAAGGVLASFIGTTGAAMLLIRPLLETNSERKHVRHTVIFFIFIVCNCGGCLLPIGDPPLFLGYLRRVPFLWTLSLWPQWLFTNGLLLLLYCLLDEFLLYPRETIADIELDVVRRRKLRFTGIYFNGILLSGVVLAVALLDPSNFFPGTNWHPWFYLREAVQLGLVAVSLLWGSKAVRAANRFGYQAIIEVAVLFCGIFICMQPALQYLNVNGAKMGVNTPVEFFWCTGSLSSVLDNAPTYVVFFETAKVKSARLVTTGQTNRSHLVADTGVLNHLLIAISLGSVFMGAMTYIGNGPNFMVKAIAEKSGVKMPSFFGYMGYSVVILLPIFFLMTLRYLR